jgi:mono/diheme cytochrome c family protein
MKISSAGILLLIAAALPLVVGGQTPPQNSSGRLPLPLEGAQIFRDYCAACHGTGGKGDGPAARALRHAPPDLTLLAHRNGGRFPRDRVKAIIGGQEQSAAAHGSREMPVWGPVFHQVERDMDLGEVRLDNVTRFIESLQHK